MRVWPAPVVGVDGDEARDEVAGLQREVSGHRVLGPHDPREHAVQPRHAARRAARIQGHQQCCI